MADPLAPLAPGNPLPTSAATWNPILAAARDRRQRPRPNLPGSGSKFGGGRVEALALNDTGADLDPFKPAAVTAAGGYTVTNDTGYEWQRQPLLTLTTPTGAGSHVAVTLEAIPDGEIGRVAVAGWTLCDVDVSDAGHGFAGPTTDTDALVSGTAGPVRIVATGTGTARRTQVYLFAGAGAGQCADYPFAHKIVVGVDFTGEEIRYRVRSVDANGCETLSEPVCEAGATCSEVEDVQWYCIGGVCWAYYDGLVPSSYDAGPFASAALCDGGCPSVPVGTDCCDPDGIPATTYIALSAGGTVTLVYSGGYWSGSKALSGCTVYFRVQDDGVSCIGIQYSRNQADWFTAACVNGEAGCTRSCDPFGVTGTYTFSAAVLGGACSFGTVTGTYGE
jgi:hypothetical protein